ncbi:hypothetical protein TNCV_1354811 [Trichonephila clavipes]|uniref:Uncharacterized protein n=1 Tax=Trichonephila clavipes TaxID=2585209 RepID=A0A8X6VI15_TRICX|nr:hypothetical protein TNCV_1354811 [Trichonephila clavipes]
MVTFTDSLSALSRSDPGTTRDPSCEGDDAPYTSRGSKFFTCAGCGNLMIGVLSQASSTSLDRNSVCCLGPSAIALVKLRSVILKKIQSLDEFNTAQSRYMLDFYWHQNSNP